MQIQPRDLPLARRIYKAERANQRRELVRYNEPYSGTGDMPRGINRGTRFAAAAWEHAKIQATFERARSEGRVRLNFIPDEDARWGDLFGDIFEPKANPDIKPHIMDRERREAEERLEREGAWGIVGEYFDGRIWQSADACFGFVGDDYEGSGVDLDVMTAALEAAEHVECCPACGRPTAEA